MNLYLISQTVNSEYDTYEAAVVAADTEEEARHITPSSCEVAREALREWADPADVVVRLVGVAVAGTAPGIILASYKAG